MTKVYFIPITSIENTEKIQKAALTLFTTLVERENITLESFLPLKVHFGEKGNTTYIHSKHFLHILDYFKEHNISSAYMETNALYVGERTTENKHMQLAKDHGFTQLPIIIADGNAGELVENVEINKKQFTHCKIGKKIADAKQLMIISHFKGHILAGFGGAVKQLGMGCAARAGKLDQHSTTSPVINDKKCVKCQKCVSNCPVDAITINESVSEISKETCIGCASCIAICPKGAIDPNWYDSGVSSHSFNERLAEYAYAAHKGKKNIYITFALNITKECDCWGESMRPILPDIGIFASTDPVACDKACFDKALALGKDFKGLHTLEHGQAIGLGSQQYELVEL